MKSVLRKYPRKYFESIFVGKEVLFREDQSLAKLVGYIDEFNRFVQTELKWDIPVGTRANVEVMKHCDFYGANMHPFLNEEDALKASCWTFDFLKYQVKPLRQLATTRQSSPKVVLSEVGWPYDGGRYHGAQAAAEQMQTFPKPRIRLPQC